MVMIVEDEMIKISFSNKMFGLQFIGLGIVLGGVIYYFVNLGVALGIFGLMFILGVILFMREPDMYEFNSEMIIKHDKEGAVIESYDPKLLSDVNVVTTRGQSNNVTGYILHLYFGENRLKIKGGAIGSVGNMQESLKIIFDYLAKHYNFTVDLGESKKVGIKGLF